MEKRIIKWGIMGTGRIARVFATALQVVDDSELCAVASRAQSKAEEFASAFNVKKAYGSYEALAADPEIDIIYIATPHNLHMKNTIMAMEHNKHVLCEKPLGINQQEVDQMIEKAASRKRFLMEALWSRFLPNIIKTKELIEEGAIGDIRMMNVIFAFKSANGPEHRHFNVQLCGGTILDIGIYNIFLSLLLFGKPDRIVAQATLSNQGVDTSCGYIFKYDNELLAVMESSFMYDAPITAEIFGSKGKITLENRWFTPGKVNVDYTDGKKEEFSFEIKGNGYELEAIEAAECIRSGKLQSDLWSWKDSRHLVSLMDTIREQCGIVYPNHDF